MEDFRKHSTVFIALASVLTIAVIACGKSDQLNANQTAPGESTSETTEIATDEGKDYELYTEKKELCSELKIMTYPWPPALEDMGSIIDMPDPGTIEVATYPVRVADDELAENMIERLFTKDTGMSGDLINDSWVTGYTNGTSVTVDEFRQKTKESWQNQLNYTYHSRIQSAALNKIIGTARIRLSDKMKDYGYNMACWSFIEKAKSNGKSIWEAINVYDNLDDLKSLKTEFRIDGEAFAKQTFVIKQIAHDQNIAATDALVDQYARKISEVYRKEYTSDMLIKQYGLARVYEYAVNNAVLEYLESQVKVTEIPEETSAPEEAETETEKETLGDLWQDTEHPSETQQDANNYQSYYGGVSDYNYTDDYDDPDDFAQEWADEYADDYDSYEDAMDDAYDIWDEEHD